MRYVEGWENEFDNLFGSRDSTAPTPFPHGKRPDIKKFIRETLAKRDAELKGKIQMAMAYRLNRLVMKLQPIAPAYSIELTNITADLYELLETTEGK